MSITEPQAKGQEPFFLLCPNLDRRYRLINFFIDSTRGFFTTPPLNPAMEKENESFDFGAIAADVINKLIAAITEIFGVLNRKDIYLVFDVPGEIWVRRKAQEQPFVRVRTAALLQCLRYTRH